MKTTRIALFFFLILIFGACAQEIKSDTVVEEQFPLNEWVSLTKGLSFMERMAPKKSIIGDSKISIVRIDPNLFDFHLLTATEHGTPLTAKEWADTFQMSLTFNASMYDLGNPLISRGFLKNFGHHNNQEVHPGYNAMIAMNPLDTNEVNCSVLDLKCEPWDSVKSNYHCYAQGMRMVDCNRQAMGWNKRKQSCSMLVAAIDDQNRFYLIFSRSPYTHNQMISFLLSFPFHLSNAIYLEGGPETSLYLNVNGKEIKRIGSYVSQTFPKDDNVEFWKLPNVIGICPK